MYRRSEYVRTQTPNPYQTQHDRNRVQHSFATSNVFPFNTNRTHMLCSAPPFPLLRTNSPSPSPNTPPPLCTKQTLILYSTSIMSSTTSYTPVPSRTKTAQPHYIAPTTWEPSHTKSCQRTTVLAKQPPNVSTYTPAHDCFVLPHFIHLISLARSLISLHHPRNPSTFPFRYLFALLYRITRSWCALFLRAF